MNKLFASVIVVALVVIHHAPVSAQPANQKVADEIIGIVKASWAAEAQKKNAEATKAMADDYTEFNGDVATRIDGKALAVRLGEAGMKDSAKPLSSEMLNEKVQVYGDTAILTYNFVGIEQDKDGKTHTMRAKSTRVYVKLGGKWMLVHANFASDPLPK